MGLFGSHSVSPVEVSLNLATATISPAEADPTGFCFFPSRRKIWPIRSLAFFPAFRGDMSGVSVPEQILKMESLPAYGSASVLNTKAEKGASTEMGRTSSVFFFGFVPFTSLRKDGSGRTKLIMSRTGWMAILRSADPQRTGRTFIACTPAVNPLRISSSVREAPSRYFSSRESSDSAAASTTFSRPFAAASARSDGTSVTSNCPVSPLYT